MDKLLDRAIKETQTPLNIRALTGIAGHQMQGVETHIDNAWRCAELGLPVGMKYTGGTRCTPLEEYKERTRPVKPQHRFEMTRSDIYMVRYGFTFKGVPIRSHYIYLPFSRGGLITLKDTQYKLMPVIGGKIFNIENHKIFMPVLLAKMGFYKTTMSCIKNEAILHTTGVGSLLFNMDKKERSKLTPTLVHYILTKYGLTETLKMFGVDNVIIGGPEVNKNTVDNKMIVYRSRQMPIILQRKNFTAKNEIRIAIPKAKVTKAVDSVICTVFYIMDQCAEAISAEDLDIPELWESLLGRFIFSKPMPLQKLSEKMSDHLLKLPMNLDPLAKRALETEGIYCKDIYELFVYLVENFNDMVIHADAGCMYNKEITILKYFLFNIVYNIFMLMYKLRKLPPHMVSVEKIEKIMMTELKSDKITETAGHGELIPASIASNALPLSATSSIISHNKATSTGGKNSKKGVGNAEAVRLHPSQFEIGSVNWITSQDPTGRHTLNPFIRLSDRNIIIPKPHLTEIISDLQKLLIDRRDKKDG